VSSTYGEHLSHGYKVNIDYGGKKVSADSIFF